MLIRLTTLGAARVHRGDTAFPDLPAQRLRFALLLYLAVEQDVSREEVVAMFWPDRDTGRGKHALRQMLYELRQVLGDDWVDVRRDRIVVQAGVDATEFERAAEEGRAADALRLYEGPFLLGFSLDNRSFEAWADRRGGHLARLHRKLQREHIAQLVASGSGDEALTAARHWVEIDPLDDEAAHTLIERLAASGQRTAALQLYDNYERQLEADLQVEPLEETRALIASIRSGEYAAAESSPAVLPAYATPVLPQASSGEGHRPEEVLASGTTAGRRTDATRVRRGPLDVWRAASVVQRAVAVIATVGIGVWVAFIARPAARVSASDDNAPISLAVLPFNDNSMDASLLPLANVLTEDLARGLAQNRTLNVITPNGVRLKRAEGAAEDSLGRALGVDYLVGGAVSKYDEHVRVDIELLDSRTGRLLRSERFERPWSESRVLVDDVVRGAAQFLRRQLSLEIDYDRADTYAANQEAWHLAAQAKTIQQPIVTLLEAQDYQGAMDRLARADSLLERAADLDPQWAEPVVQRGWILDRRAFIAVLPESPERESRRELVLAALAMADEAAKRQPEVAGVHALRGAVLHQLSMMRFQPHDSAVFTLRQAEEELLLATQLDPLDQGAWRRLADVYFTDGRYGESAVAAEQGFLVDPYGTHREGLTYLRFANAFEMGDDLQADGWCMQGFRQAPDNPAFLYCMLALNAWATGVDPDPAAMRQAMSNFQEVDRRGQPQLPSRYEMMMAAVYARAGQADSARAILARIDSGDPGVLWMRASVHANLLEDSIALSLLEQYVASGSRAAMRVAHSRPFSELRKRTELEQLIRAGARPR